MRTAAILLLAACFSFLVGCTEEPADGCGVLVWDESGDGEHRVHFGSLLSCEMPVARATLRNVGACAVDLVGTPERLSGDPVSFGAALQDEAPFNVHVMGSRLAPNEAIEVEVAWHFTGEWRRSDQEARIRLRGRRGETAELTLATRIVSVQYDFPGELDFGKVEVGETYELGWEIQNPTQLPSTWHVGPLQSASTGTNAFTFAPGSAQGEVTVPPDSSTNVMLRFTPSGEGVFRAAMPVGVPPCGELTTTMLEGEGVSSILTFEPTVVDCGYVPVGLEVERTLTILNHGPEATWLRNFGSDAPDAVSVVLPAPGEELSIPRAERDAEGRWQPSSASITVTCHPRTEERLESALTFKRGERTYRMPIRQIGGGPDIDAPSVVDFGKVQWFPGASPPEFQTRRLTVANVGTVTTDAKANLLVAPDVTLTPLNAQTQPGEFEVSFPASYEPAKGVTGNGRLELEVKFTPTSQGLKEADLTLRTNDVDEPEVRIRLTGNVMTLPSCDVSLSAAQVDFGVVSPAEVLDLVLTVRNTRTAPGELCVVSGVDLTRESPPYLSLPEGPLPSTELDPGEALRIPVRLETTENAPAGTTNLTGTLVLHTSSGNHARVLIPLTAQLTSGCLTLAPRSLDFGAAQVGCSGRTQTVRVYNHCTTPVTFNPSLTEPSGYVVSNEPTTPVSFARGDSPATFDVTFTPTGEGVHDGHLELSIVQDGVSSTYVVPVVGRGDGAGVAVDTFTVGPSALDLLFVIGPTPSASISGLAAAVPSFVSHAQTMGLDYQVAVTAMDVVPDGALFGGITDRIVRPTSADPAGLLSSRILQFGGAGPASCFDSAVSALTPPLSLGYNAGFVRTDASLAVVCLSELPDMSLQASGWQLDALRNLKGGRRSAFAFNAVSGFSDACPIDDGKLSAAVDATGGIKADLCTANWTQLLQSLAELGDRTRTTFDLRSEPDPQGSGPTVTRNGAPVGGSAWSWIPTTNQIVFSPVFAPLQGDTITVTYPVACNP